MDSKDIKITTVFFVFSLALLFFILWLVDYSNLGIPTLIPQVNWSTYGILIMLAFMLVHFSFQKMLLKSERNMSTFKLTCLSVLITFLSLLVYQITRQNLILQLPISISELLSVVIPTLIFGLMALSTALSLKKAKFIYRQIPFAIILILLSLKDHYVGLFEW